jgi:hypothetical protein
MVALTVVGLAVAVLVAPLPAALVERWYSRGLYIHLQRVLTPLTNPIPIALLDLAAIALLLIGARGVTRLVRSAGAPTALRVVALRAPVVLAAAYLVFLAVWGLNYRRVPLEQKLEFDDSGINPAAARRLASEAVRIVNETFEGARGLPDQAALWRGFGEAQRVLGAGSLARPGVPKRSVLGLYFRWAAIDGMTNPFFLEIIVNPDLLEVERPFVLAHEWAHLAGYADESEANFVAWLSCERGDAQSRYSGWLAVYAHLSNALPPQDRGTLADMLGPGPRRDLLAINARLMRSRPVVRHAARDVYDSYLKVNRVERGIASYDAVVRLVLGAQFDEGWRPRLRRQAW